MSCKHMNELIGKFPEVIARSNTSEVHEVIWLEKYIRRWRVK